MEERSSWLVLNRLRGTAVRGCEGARLRRPAMLEDIAILAGGKAITEDLGIKQENIKVENLGSAKKVTIDTTRRPSSGRR